MTSMMPQSEVTWNVNGEWECKCGKVQPTIQAAKDHCKPGQKPAPIVQREYNDDLCPQCGVERQGNDLVKHTVWCIFAHLSKKD